MERSTSVGSSLQSQTRVFLWAVPRSISTAVFRAMMNKPRCKALLEPFSEAYYFGEERVSSRYSSVAVRPNASFTDIKVSCELSYSDYDTVFVKDMAYYLSTQLDTPAVLPANYLHTFLVRDPSKSVYSLYKMSHDKRVTGWDYFDRDEVGFKELYHLFKLVTNQLGQPPIVIDADDLLQQPEAMFRAYCDKIGVQFDAKMLKWNDATEDVSVFQSWLPWFEGVLTSTTFQPSTTKPHSPPTSAELPRHVQQVVDECSVYYRQMYEERLRPAMLNA